MRDDELDERLARFERDGYLILERAIDAAFVRELKETLAPYEAALPKGRNDFEGTETKRVYSLAGKGEPFMRLAEHPAIVAMLDRLLMPGWLLSNLQSIRIHPGETPQPWHADDTFYPLPRPRTKRLAVSTIWAIEDFTADNGATELAPGSHRWAYERPDDATRTIQAIMPAGSVIVFDGALWHRGGRHRAGSATRLAISPQYCQPWLRPQESMLLIVPPDEARAMSARGRSMLGYNIHPPFVGQVDGMHPLRLVDPDYAKHKTRDHEIADEVLADPKAVM
jgi:ectoine hydroxylase-related dioxygenase (phytanoyl-CoA dioxygenase family)